jgi:hypothetical protein
MSIAVDKRRRIQGLWAQLGRAELKASECQLLMNKIRMLPQLDSAAEISQAPCEPA